MAAEAVVHAVVRAGCRLDWKGLAYHTLGELEDAEERLVLAHSPNVEEVFAGEVVLESFDELLDALVSIDKRHGRGQPRKLLPWH